MSDYSTFLFTSPSGLGGAASVVDLAGQLTTFNRSVDGVAADLRALRADHGAVVSDALAALDEFAAVDA